MHLVFFAKLDKKLYHFELEMFYMKWDVGIDCVETALNSEYVLNPDPY